MLAITLKSHLFPRRRMFCASTFNARIRWLDRSREYFKLVTTTGAQHWKFETKACRIECRHALPAFSHSMNVSKLTTLDSQLHSLA